MGVSSSLLYTLSKYIVNAKMIVMTIMIIIVILMKIITSSLLKKLDETVILFILLSSFDSQVRGIPIQETYKWVTELAVVSILHFWFAVDA